jgi:osmoprotectant transport system ATP-binding protein
MVHLKGISKIYEGKYVLKNIDVEVHRGELLVILGESGSGKSTLLKCINHLVHPDEGLVEAEEELFTTSPAYEWRRKFGYVFQNIGLFPHMTVLENLYIVPDMNSGDSTDKYDKAAELLKLVGLPAAQFGNRFPSELSGGQQQRVGVARALATSSPVMLMDEPFSALDPITRYQLQRDLLSWKSHYHLTVVFVTHDIREARFLADRIVIMEKGQIAQLGVWDELRQNPANEYIESLLNQEY